MAFKDAPTETDIADFLAARGARPKKKRSVREALDADCLAGSRPATRVEGETRRQRFGGRTVTLRRRAAIALLAMSVGAGIGAVGQYAISDRDLDLKMLEMAEMTIEKLRSLTSQNSSTP